MSIRKKQKNVFYLACDKNGDTYLFENMPERNGDVWWNEEGVCYKLSDLYLDESQLPQITWENNPYRIVINSNIYIL